MNVSDQTARHELANELDKQPIIKSYEAARKQAYLSFWQQHPALLYQAWQAGYETLNDDERAILADAAQRKLIMP